MNFTAEDQWRVGLWVSMAAAKGLIDDMVDCSIYGAFPLMSMNASAGAGLALNTIEEPARPVLTFPLGLEWLVSLPWRRLVLCEEGLFLVGLTSTGAPFGFGLRLDRAARAVFNRAPAVADLGVMRPTKRNEKVIWGWKGKRVLTLENRGAAPLVQAIDSLTG
ncbi:hypothetical protein [Alcanivorax sp. 1008]|uniref:hypothetical protein n=1 Tax=Alcanivorax sp. 1008 TaxID=2816853 RepID=UPI001D41BA39|nr:hypothetical protein [Alcanivorax sp. 1008]MCC1496743.1 hypothetical protein [Alcanivorax sp. 1008]